MIQDKHPFRTTPATPAASAATTPARVGIIIPTRLAARANGNGNALHNATVVVTGGVHAVVDGEIAADEVRAHGGALSGQNLRGTDHVCLVLAVVDADHARIARWGYEGFIGRFWPAAAAAEACRGLAWVLPPFDWAGAVWYDDCN